MSRILSCLQLCDGLNTGIMMFNETEFAKITPNGEQAAAPVKKKQKKSKFEFVEENYDDEEEEDDTNDYEALDQVTITGQSKIGGFPDLPKNMAWPTHADFTSGKQVNAIFVAQISLREANWSDVENRLPSNGMLWFFCANTNERNYTEGEGKVCIAANR